MLIDLDRLVILTLIGTQLVDRNREKGGWSYMAMARDRPTPCLSSSRATGPGPTDRLYLSQHTHR